MKIKKGRQCRRWSSKAWHWGACAGHCGNSERYDQERLTVTHTLQRFSRRRDDVTSMSIQIHFHLFLSDYLRRTTSIPFLKAKATCNRVSGADETTALLTFHFHTTSPLGFNVSTPPFCYSWGQLETTKINKVIDPLFFSIGIDAYQLGEVPDKFLLKFTKLFSRKLPFKEIGSWKHETFPKPCGKFPKKVGDSFW